MDVWLIILGFLLAVIGLSLASSLVRLVGAYEKHVRAYTRMVETERQRYEHDTGQRVH